MLSSVHKAWNLTRPPHMHPNMDNRNSFSSKLVWNCSHCAYLHFIGIPLLNIFCGRHIFIWSSIESSGKGECEYLTRMAVNCSLVKKIWMNTFAVTIPSYKQNDYSYHYYVSHTDPTGLESPLRESSKTLTSCIWELNNLLTSLQPLHRFRVIEKKMKKV